MLKRVSSPKNENETFTRPHFVLNLRDFLLWNTKKNFLLAEFLLFPNGKFQKYLAVKQHNYLNNI